MIRIATRRLIVAAAASLLTTTLLPLASGAQQVSLVIGTVQQPPALKTGDRLRAGDRITVAADGLVVIQDQWRSDQRGMDCVRRVVISNTTYRVEPATPGSCPVQDDAALLGAAEPGGRLLAKNVLYFDNTVAFDPGKADGFPASSRFERALQARTDRLLDDATKPVVRAPSPAPRTSLLSCRGGGSLAATYYSALSEILIRFTWGSGPASTGLRPGECGWHERVVRRDEPVLICHTVDVINISWQSQGRVSVSSGEAPYLAEIGNRQRSFVFHVYEDPQSNPKCLRAVRIPR